jgi:hypothetical protein
VLKAIQPLHDECRLILHDLSDAKSHESGTETNNTSITAQTASSHSERPRSLYGRRRFLAGIDRAELYRKVWIMLIREVAASYRLSYHQLEKICRLLDVPKPTRGFWSRKAFGNPTGVVPSLPPLRMDLPTGTSPVRESSVSTSPTVDELNPADQADGPAPIDDRPGLLVAGGLMLLYNREQLYEDVWSFPLSGLAEKYGVSDRALAKACRKLHVPVPTMGHWNKIAAHKPGDDKPPLPSVSIAPRIIRRKARVHSPGEAASIVQRIDDQLLNGTTLSAGCTAFGISESTYWRWKKASAAN